MYKKIEHLNVVALKNIYQNIGSYSKAMKLYFFKIIKT